MYSKNFFDFKNAGLTLPIYPSFEGYKIGDYSAIKNHNIQYYGIWDFDELDSDCAAFISGGTVVVNTDQAVVTLQQNLNTLIKAALVVDGIQGPLTTAAVVKFQGIMGLSQDGIAGSKTNGAINQILARPLDGIPMPHYEYATRWIQWKVGAGIDGIYGAITASKVEQFQILCNNNYRANLAIDGIVGPMTWDALFKY